MPKQSSQEIHRRSESDKSSRANSPTKEESAGNHHRRIAKAAEYNAKQNMGEPSRSEQVTALAKKIKERTAQESNSPPYTHPPLGFVLEEGTYVAKDPRQSETQDTHPSRKRLWSKRDSDSEHSSEGYPRKRPRTQEQPPQPDEDQPGSTDIKGKGHAFDIESDVAQPSKQHPDHFNNQAITKIFPRMNLDRINDSAEREAYEYVLGHYVHELHKKAAEAYPEILRCYDNSEIYYKCYGGVGRKDLTQLIAVRNTRNGKISVGPSESRLRELGIYTKHKHLFSEINIQKVSEHLQNEKLQEEKPVQWVMYDALKPVYKKKRVYERKTGPTGLYLTDNYTQLANELGGYSQNITALHNRSAKTSGPWTLPDGAVKVTRQQKNTR